MSEFGHFGHIVAGCAIDAWGAGPFTIRHKDKQWSFEFSDRFGPVLLNRNGEPSERQPISQRHPFWKPFNAWLSQGKQIDDGVAIWREPLPTVMRHVAGRHYVTEQVGEGHGEIIFKPKEYNP